ncbi:alpha-N-acetylglucosaminidase [Chitinophaga horti]|uniref:Alpha-N-acetylglucosaminidase n=1 Tax=Chitinophaga horti TaxID=2920382 RepID=A0ABY6J1N6_9BACT|nr:alpha-N-acetylglucosaminidase [Chitinophaga horti]UYQ92124.1 alpha-N-acetylglucosaminidase [Chitinophaga horti]
MKKIFHLLLLALPVQLTAAEFSGVYQLVKRRVPWLEKHITFEQATSNNGQETFTLQTRQQKLVISASGPNAAAVGLNWYLRNYCHRSMSHMGDNLSPVKKLPVIRVPVTVNASALYRHALNYCTFNYTMSFYNWADWEHELDWMALNGVNMMLVANGSEAVWQKTLQQLGYTQKEIDQFITGPAYNAWWLMGNIEAWGGPMPQSQIDDRRRLVQKMLVRMRSLGIEPVMPAFFGMVPKSLTEKTKAHIIKQGTWGAFPRPDILDPTDTAFARIAGLFYAATKEMYGSNIRFFSGDPFHEGGVTEGVDLGKAGANIQRVMRAWFPGAIWVLQGWQDNPKKALLAETDRSALLVQELFGENTNNWETREGYEGTPFIWCTVTNFGERPGLNGKLQRFADEVHRARTGPYKAYMKGVGIMPEGIDNNPAVYELLMELAWHENKVDTKEWAPVYAAARYGKPNNDVNEAWQGFLQTIYSNPGYQEGPPENILCARPALEIKSVSRWGNLRKGYDTALYVQAVKAFAKAAPVFTGSETYKIDLVNFTRQVIANRADKVFADVVNAYQAKDKNAFNAASQAFLQLCDDEETLLNTQPYFRLRTYQQKAIRGGANDFLNAMMLITYWGGTDHNEDNLHEYAYKEWAGLIRTFYRKRWEIFFAHLSETLSGKASQLPDWYNWEREWVRENLKVMPAEKPVDLGTIVHRILH